MFQVKASIEKKLGKKTIFTAINFRAVDTKIYYIAKVSFIILFYIPLAQTEEHSTNAKVMDLIPIGDEWTDEMYLKYNVRHFG